MNLTHIRNLAYLPYPPKSFLSIKLQEIIMIIMPYACLINPSYPFHVLLFTLILLFWFMMSRKLTVLQNRARANLVMSSMHADHVYSFLYFHYHISSENLWWHYTLTENYKQHKNNFQTHSIKIHFTSQKSSE